MKPAVSFKIYSASAGSGKTFTLVKEYLKKAVCSKNSYDYKNLLAITFTNKAVAEMKERIIANLVAFSEKNSLENPPEMLQIITQETGKPIEELRQQSKKVLKHLLHHYANFNVETIDRFNHHLIRTFSRDLKLSSSFEVSLEVDALLSEAVENLVNKTGESPEITSLLLDFMYKKTDDDLSWDISRDLVNAAKILYKENDLGLVHKLKERTLTDFTLFKKELNSKKKELTKTVEDIANQTLELIAQSGLEHQDFSRSSYPNYFLKLQSGDFNVNFGLAWQETMPEKPMYPSKILKESPHVAETIDELLPVFIKNFTASKKALFKLQLITNILKNVTPLSVLSLIEKEITQIKEDQNILPITEFNTLIHSHIKDQPAPFIYERLGEKFQHFFIDEFQDTSKLQWQNLIPLIENAVSQEDFNNQTGSLLLVGDTKQSIYRWRGGLPEQFLDLCNEINPFPIKKEVENLPYNFRSFAQIVNFNNAFFSFLASIFGNEAHSNLYLEGNKQQLTKADKGFVQFNFIDTEEKEKDQEYASHIINTIQQLTEHKYTFKDLCILVRRKKDGVSISEALLSHNIPVISQETLLLANSKLVNCIVFVIKILHNPKDDLARVEFLSFVHKLFNLNISKHDFIVSGIKTTMHELSQLLKSYNITLDFEQLKQLPLYPSCEYIIEQFKLDKIADAYLFGFMDFVFEFTKKSISNIEGFLAYWELKKGSAAIASSNTQNAVQVMTIHKSKGLEFPVVLFPYANVSIYHEIDSKIWYPLDKKDYSFDEMLISFKKEVANYDATGKEKYQERRNTLELDSINLLYVTLTRAIEQLYIFSEKPKLKKTESPSNFNDIFVSFLENKSLWDESKLIYSFGNFESKISESKKSILTTIPAYSTSSLESHNIYMATREASLWDTEAQKAIVIGNMLHDTMALIHTSQDLTDVLATIEKSNLYNADAFKQLTQTTNKIVLHKELSHLFSTNAIVKTEKDIIQQNGEIIRPDRINFFLKNCVSLIDYKTGKQSTSYELQINSYAEALNNMGYQVTEKILVYVSETDISINKL